jgi:predicted signal transduction protein with EAL and GGDEF domain
VLHLALSQARKWADAGRSIPVAVNISARSLLDPRFPAHVQELLDAHGVAPYLLSLELTETAVMADHDLALAVLKALDSMGVSLSIDDFGTGYSSMSYLKTLPVKELKIDRSFVMGMADQQQAAIRLQLQEEGGRGLFLVAALSSRWDWYRTPEPPGARSSGANWRPDPHGRHYYAGFEIASEPYEHSRAAALGKHAST